jgi:toxin ParE1/3/4
LIRNGIRNAYLFHADKDEGAAAKAVDTIRKGANVLKQFPQAGRPADDLEPEHRELLIPFGGPGYAIFYEVMEDAVYLLAVKHQKEAGC